MEMPLKPTRADTAEYLPLVRNIAYSIKKKLPQSVNIDDLIQAGSIGLLLAFDRYNPESGASFQTYAGILIRGHILDEIRMFDWTPRSVYKQGRMIESVRSAIEARERRPATTSEIQREAKISADEYHKAIHDKVSTSLLSVDALAEEYNFYDWYQSSTSHNPADFLETWELDIALKDTLMRLPEREAEVLRLHSLGNTLHAIGDALGVSESRACQLYGNAVLRLKQHFMTDQSTHCVACILEHEGTFSPSEISVILETTTQRFCPKHRIHSHHSGENYASEVALFRDQEWDDFE